MGGTLQARHRQRARGARRAEAARGGGALARPALSSPTTRTHAAATRTRSPLRGQALGDPPVAAPASPVMGGSLMADVAAGLMNMPPEALLQELPPPSGAQHHAELEAALGASAHHGGDGGRGARLDGRRGPPGPRRRRRRAREAAAGGQEAAWRAPRGVNVFTLTWAVKADFQTTHTMFSPQYAELRSDPLSVGVHQCKFRRAAYWTVPAQAYFGRGYARSTVSDRQPLTAWPTSPAASLWH